jgi:hypothetical protein
MKSPKTDGPFIEFPAFFSILIVATQAPIPSGGPEIRPTTSIPVASRIDDWLY